MSEVTQLLGTFGNGDSKAAEELLPLVYQELRALAGARMAQENPGHTLQPTALVHEAWLRIAGAKGEARFANRVHFFASAAEAMRRILVDNARRKAAAKRGGRLQRTELDDLALPVVMSDEDLLALDGALERLASFNERAADVVKLRFFVGLTQEQVACELDLSVSTVERLWVFARTFLYREVQKDRNGVPEPLR